MRHLVTRIERRSAAARDHLADDDEARRRWTSTSGARGDCPPTRSPRPTPDHRRVRERSRTRGHRVNPKGRRDVAEPVHDHREPRPRSGDALHAERQAVTQFTVAVNELAWQNEEWQEETEWFRVVVWAQAAERLPSGCARATRSTCEAASRRASGKTRAQKRYTTELVADKVTSLERRERDADGESRLPRRRGEGGRAPRPRPPRPPRPMPAMPAGARLRRPAVLTVR
jgi:single-stranded DNA-binding protein